MKIEDLYYPPNLPITEKREEIVKLIRENQVIILAGETGSGKTTQIPKFCIEAGRGQKGKIIGCTQPRRIAALSVAARIAEELKVPLGSKVGYKIRFDEKLSKKSQIKLMTDGVLLAETQSDRLLSHYDTIIVDEAHERSLNIDFLLGVLRGLVKKRPDLKIIITSATIDTQKFSKAFEEAPIIEVSGRTYPVEVRYRPPSDEGGEKSLAESGADALEEILLETTGGDVLIFMPTEQDILECCETIGNRYSQWNLNVLPLFARLTSQEQHRIFETSTRRKIVVSTNVAETSLTIPGIVYVIDTGVARIARYTPSTGTFGLPIESVSKSSADQRKGRCGRIEEGICIRLYSEEDYNGRTLYTPPEVLRTNLAEVILRMLSLKIYDVDKFPFVDPPQGAGIRDGFKTLEELRCIKEVNNREYGKREGAPKKIKILTKEGFKISNLPMDPRLGKMILQGNREGCVNEALILAGALSIHDPRERPPEKAGTAAQKHALFRHEQSDFLTLINIFKGWQKIGDGKMKLGALKKYCKENYLSFKRMREWRDLYLQFKSILKESGIEARSFEGKEDAYYQAIHRSVLAGFLSHISHKKEKNFYEATRQRETMIFPGSGLFNRGGEWMVSAEMVKTTRLYMRINCNIETSWVSHLANHIVKRSYINPWWDEKKGEVLCHEEERLYGFLLSNDRIVPYGQYKPKEASLMFIKEGLLGEDSLAGKEPDFLKANRKLWEDLNQVEDKLRQRNILHEESVVESFYRERLDSLSQRMAKPTVICDVGQLNFLIKELGDKELFLKESDLLANPEDEFSIENYPDYYIQDDQKFTLEYKFNPGEEDDGVTLRVPANRLSLLDPHQIDTTVRSNRDELVTALLRGLPKEKRKKLIPINSHVTEIVKLLDPHNPAPIIEQITPIIYREFGLNITPADWNEEKIPEHLKLRFAIEDKRGKIIKSSREKSILFEKRDTPRLGGKQVAQLKNKWERSDLIDWKGVDLPEQLSLSSAGQISYLFPALQFSGGAVCIRLFQDRSEARRNHSKGAAALYHRFYRKEVKSFKASLDLKSRTPKEVIYLGKTDDLEEMIWQRIFDDLFNKACRSEGEFEDQRQEKGPHIFDLAERYYDRAIMLLESYSRCRQALAKVRREARKGREQFIASREADLIELVPQDFPLKYDGDRWLDLVRYVRTVTTRIEKGIHDPLSDKTRQQEFDNYFLRYQKIVGDLSVHASEKKREAVDELFWFLHEYKVALFGGGVVKAALKVSPQRIEKKFDTLLGLV